MSSVRFEIEGLEQLRNDLLALPRVLADKAERRVTRATLVAAARIRDGYPERRGGLRKGVKTKVERDNVSVVGTVRSTARHASLYENGTQARHTDLGISRGRMPRPPAKVFIPTMAAERRAMYEDLKAIVAGEGLEVSGDA